MRPKRTRAFAPRTRAVGSNDEPASVAALPLSCWIKVLRFSMVFAPLRYTEAYFRQRVLIFSASLGTPVEGSLSGHHTPQVPPKSPNGFGDGNWRPNFMQSESLT